MSRSWLVRSSILKPNRWGKPHRPAGYGWGHPQRRVNAVLAPGLYPGHPGHPNDHAVRRNAGHPGAGASVLMVKSSAVQVQLNIFRAPRWAAQLDEYRIPGGPVTRSRLSGQIFRIDGLPGSRAEFCSYLFAGRRR